MDRCTWNILSAQEREDKILVNILRSFWYQEDVVTELWNTESNEWKSGQLRIEILSVQVRMRAVDVQYLEGLAAELFVTEAREIFWSQGGEKRL